MFAFFPEPVAQLRGIHGVLAMLQHIVPTSSDSDDEPDADADAEATSKDKSSKAGKHKTGSDKSEDRAKAYAGQFEEVSLTKLLLLKMNAMVRFQFSPPPMIPKSK
jgi:hypothetical protein